MSLVIQRPTGARLTLKKESVTADPYYNNVSLLLHGDGTNGSTTIVDSSPSPKTVTAVGNAQISTTVTDAFSRTGVGVIALGGTGDYLTVSSTGTPGNLGAGDFTVEVWHFLTSRVSNFPCLIGNYSSFAAGSFGLFAGHSSSTTTKYQLALNGGSFPAINSAANISYNQRVHLAVVRSGSTITLYVNGIASGSTTNTATFSGTSGSLWVGATGDSIANSAINGYIDDLRITKGVARYTSNFTPPASPFPEVLG